MSVFCENKDCFNARNELNMVHAETTSKQRIKLEESYGDYCTLESVIRCFEDGLIGDRKKGKDTPKESFPYIPLGIDVFIKQMKYAKKVLAAIHHIYPQNLYHHKFIDVGCGIGTKVIIARQFFNAYGLELSKKYCEVSKKMFPRKDNRIINCNALTFKKYKMFDIIYYYCPISDSVIQRKLEQRIFRNAKPGAMIICNLCKHKKIEIEPYGFAAIDTHRDDRYKKGDGEDHNFFIKGDSDFLEKVKKIVEEKKLWCWRN
jgi:SAM-dependent methyltransferase